MCTDGCVVQLWDVATGACELTLEYHAGKVQALAWNQCEAPVLLSGAFGGGVHVCDTRAGDDAVATWAVEKDVEAVAWGHAQAAPTQFAVSRDDGHVVCFDTRGGAGSDPLFTLAAHNDAATGVTFSPSVPHTLFTCSVDKTVKVWSVADAAPRLLHSQDVAVGAVLCMAIPPDLPQLVVAGGAKGEVTVWDTTLCSELQGLAAS
jgi:periodic tryptophan protein 1